MCSGDWADAENHYPQHMGQVSAHLWSVELLAVSCVAAPSWTTLVRPGLLSCEQVMGSGGWGADGIHSRAAPSGEEGKGWLCWGSHGLCTCKRSKAWGHHLLLNLGVTQHPQGESRGSSAPLTSMNEDIRPSYFYPGRAINQAGEDLGAGYTTVTPDASSQLCPGSR